VPFLIIITDLLINKNDSPQVFVKFKTNNNFFLQISVKYDIILLD
jgi:hypothetical protein